ncbi:polycystin-1-like [Mantella aurantiaca]
MESKPTHEETRELVPFDTNDDDFSSEQGWSTKDSLRCPPACRCTETHVDCSGVGLLAIPSAKECPPNTITICYSLHQSVEVRQMKWGSERASCFTHEGMDLSGNQLTVLHMTVLSELRSLRELNLSHNQVSIIEEAKKISLPQLQTLDLSGNRLLCNCPLQGLISRMTKRGRLIMDPEVESCAHDSSLLLMPCADHYVSCVWVPQHNVLHYSLITPHPFSSNSCIALCFRHGFSYYGMDSMQRCLCGLVSLDDDDPCLGVCSRNGNIHMCNKSIIPDLHAVQVTLLLSAPSYYNVLQPAEFHVVSSIPVDRFVWEFQDGSKSVITANGVVSHRYSLPGKYKVKVRAEAQQPGAEIPVTMAVALDMAELQCPVVAPIGQSVEVWLQVNQGTDLHAVYSIQLPGGQLLTDDSSCPRGGRVFRENLHCFWINQVKESQSDARSRCQLIPGGDLVYITSAAQLHFIQESFRSNSPVWVNISQSLKEVNRKLLTEPDSGVHEIQEDCLLLSLQTRDIYQRSPCVEKAPSICECQAGVHLPDAPVYLVGVPIFDDTYTENATLSPSINRPQNDIEVMIFPGLWFSHSGSLLALDLGIQPVQHELLARIQILRPFCSPEQHLIPPGCVALWSPFATCNSQSLCNTTGDCPCGWQWCPLSESCLKLNRPCSTYASTHYPFPPRYSGTPPSYSPVADVLLKLSKNVKERNIQVQLSHLSHSVHPDDILSIQHTGNPETFLRCKSSTDSPWRQTYASMRNQGWLEDSFQLDTDIWVDDVVCDLRVLYGSEFRSLVVSSLLSNFQEDGTYVVSAALSNGVSSTLTNCDITILSPVSDLHIVHPALGSDCLHVVTHHPTLVVISAQSSSPARVHWSTAAQSGESVLQQKCPLDVSSNLTFCTTLSLNVGFAWMWLSFVQPQITRLTILVTNEVSSINLTMPIQSHDTIQGLSIRSNGPDYVKLNQTRIFSAEVTRGTTVTFTWTMDDNEGFSYMGASYMVTFRIPGVYRLKLVAQNPISFQEEEIILQVEEGIPLQEAELLVSSTVLLASETHTIIFTAKVQRSSDVTISWDFGDGSPLLNRSFCAPHETQNSKGFLVTLNNTECHVYTKEGNYHVFVKAYIGDSEITRTLQLQVVHRLSSLSLKVDLATLEVHKTVLFSAICLPSPFSVTVTWNFGDKSDTVQSDDFEIQHIYKSLGTYNVKATATNGQTCVTGSLMVTIEEKIQGLQLLSNEPTELGTESIYTIQVNNILPDVFTSHLKTQLTADLIGPSTLLKFCWDFGDGNQPILVQGKAEVWHSYIAAGIYVVRVRAKNLVGFAEAFIMVDVQEPIEGVSIYQENPSVVGYAGLTEPLTLTAHVVKGTNLTFRWVLWPGPWESNNSSISFHPTKLGEILAEVWVENALGVGYAQIQLKILQRIRIVYIQKPASIVALGTPVNVTVFVKSGSDLEYTWHLGEGSVMPTSQKQSVTLLFLTPGSKNITVIVFNALSSTIVSTVLTVQEVLSNLSIDIKDTYNSQAVLSHKIILLCGSVENGTDLTWKWSISGMNKDLIYNSQNVSHIFTDPGPYWLWLLAWNSVSNASTSLSLLVQDAVSGFTVSVEKKIFCIGQEIKLCPSVDYGTNVSFTLMIPQLNLSQTLINNCSHIEFSSSGTFNVLATAYNKVSRANFSHSIEVEESVKDLKVIDLPSSWPVDQTMHLTATLESGHATSFQWTFQQVGQHEFILMGQSIQFTCLKAGTLHIFLNASNPSCFSTLTSAVIIQSPVTKVYLQSVSKEVFLNQCVTFRAVVSDGSDLHFLWTFEDDDKNVTGIGTSVEYCYKYEGNFVTRVSAFNLVSIVYAQTTVSVGSLTCEQPQVQILEPAILLHRSFGGNFEINVNLRGCTKYRALYLWQIYKGADCSNNILTVPKLDTSKTSLSIPGHTLNIGIYCLLFTITLEGTPLFNNATHVFQVRHSSLVAQIHGGSKRIWPVDLDLSLDGTQSYDPDLDEGQKETDMEYEWNVEPLENQGTSCPTPSLPGLPRISVIWAAFCANSSFIFTLTVRKPGRHAATAQQTFTWRAVDSLGHGLTLDKNTTISGPGSPELVIRRGVLQNYLDYTFYLRVTQQRGPEWGESSIILMPNKPPIGGECSLLPQHTILWLETLLEYNCTGWKDPDLDTQLLYSLSVGLCSASGCQKLHLYRGLKSQYSVRPPVGSEVGEVQVYVEVEDMQGAKTLALNCTLLVSVSQVFPGIYITQWLRNHSRSILEHMGVVGDTPLVIQLALEMVTALNLGVHHDVDMPVWLNVLNATEKMIRVLNERGDQEPDADIPQNIITLLGVALASSNSDDLSLAAFNLTRTLTVALGRSRVQGEDPLVIAVPGVRAQVTRVPTELALCSTPMSLCHTSKPHNLSHTLASHHELLQVTIELEDNPFPAGLPSNLTMSSQLAALEFTSINGETVPVKDLPEGLAIQLTLPIREKVVLSPVSAVIPPRGSANFTVTTSMAHRSAGMHLHISFTQLNESDWSLEESPLLLISYGPLQFFNNSDMQRIHILKFSLGQGNTQNLTLLLPSICRSLLEYQINITSLLFSSSISVSVSFFSSLCQYFHVPSLTWRTDGLSPTNASLPHQAVCQAQHLTLFGASLFVPPHQLVWLSPSPRRWTLALTCCLVLLSLYLLLILITHKLDHLDLSRVGTIPLCGPQGQYRYWVLVKTGWRRGAGTTAHVGICLYGLNKSGARHLNSRGGLTTGSVNMFQIETDTNLGEIWKIRVWHDNTGLDPSWFLQYVAVWDKQTDFIYFFLVHDWLSVENERNGGRVEKEILATCPQEFSSFSQVFPQQLFLGITDWHLWLSVWWRPAHSRFTRVQRVTCCVLALHLYMTICSLWYGAIGIQEGSSVTGLQSLVTWESIFIGIFVSVMVVPVQLIFSFLFRETRSLIFVEDSTTSTQTTEQDVHMDTSSALSLAGKVDSLLDISSLSCASLNSSKFTFDIEKDGSWFAERSGPVWMSSCESLYDARGDILTESGLGFTQALCKEKEKDQLGFLSSCSSGDDPLSLSEGSDSSPHFTTSEENLHQSIAAETPVWKCSEESDSGRFSPRPDLGSPSTESGYSLMTENEDCYMTRCWSESHPWCDTKRRSFSSSTCVSEGTSNESELQECWDIPSASPSPFTTRIGVRWKPFGWLFPPWMLWVVYIMAFILLAGCVAVTVLYTSSLSEHGFFLWLISCTFALLSSAVILEPLKVLLLSLYNAVYRPPVLSEGMGLVEEPLIRKITDHADKVRAPGGFSLQQAKEEARRVRALRSMIQSCTGYMVFLLLVLLMYFHISYHDHNIRLLHSTIKHSITNSVNIDMNAAGSASSVWRWLHITLPAYLYQDPQLKLIRAPRLCQLHSLTSTVLDWTSTLQSPPGSAPCTNFTVGSNFSIDYSSCIQKSCLELGDTKEKTFHLIQALNNFDWINKSILQVEITQYHKDVGLYISTIVHLDQSPFGNRAFRLSILPFHLEKPVHVLNLPMTLALSLLLAALLFLHPELASLAGFCSSGSSYSPHWTRLLLGLASAGTGLVHIGRICLTKHRMELHHAKPWAFISLYDVALLSRIQVALSATLLLLIMLKVAQQFRFVRRWAVFVKTFQSLQKELPGLVLFMAVLLLALTHCMNLVTCVLLPALNICCDKYSDLLWTGRSFWPMLKCVPCLGWLGLSVLLMCRGLLCGSILTSYRRMKTECYRLALEPQDYEMIDFFVKRFKLWLGVNKVKEYRHSVKFEGLGDYSTRSSPASSHMPPETELVHRPASAEEHDLFLSSSPRPVRSPSLAVEHLPRAISDLLDRMDKVTLVLKEVSTLEQKLKLWQIMQKSTRLLQKETSTSMSDEQILPRTDSTFSESALTCIKSNIVKSNSYKFSRWAAPLKTGLPRHPASAGQCSRTRMPTRRPHSEDSSRGHKQNEDIIHPFPLKRRAWDSEKPGGGCHSPSVTSIKGSILP